MTRDQAQKIANDIFDAVEREGHMSKDLVVDAIFNSWHKQTADNRKWVAYEVIRNAISDLGTGPAAQYLDGAMLADAMMSASMTRSGDFYYDVKSLMQPEP